MIVTFNEIKQIVFLILYRWSNFSDQNYLLIEKNILFN